MFDLRSGDRLSWARGIVAAHRFVPDGGRVSLPRIEPAPRKHWRRPKMDRSRCDWCLGAEIMTRYHDTEWGVPVHDDRKHFEFMVLDSLQAGLSWLIVLKKREAYRAALDGFNPERVAAYTEADYERIMANPALIRNRAKTRATMANARAFLRVQERFGSFDRYIWRFVDGRTVRNAHASPDAIPTRSPISDAMSKDLKQRGFAFVGTTICYAYMQAAGLVNDHLVTCFRYDEV
jgi:DNA-3-methyladenine glycosylase I